MSNKSKIHFAPTTEIRLDMTGQTILLMNGGVHPDIEPNDMRLFGYRDEVEFEGGLVQPGIIEPINLWYIEHPSGAKIVVDTGCTAELSKHANEVFKSRNQGQFYVTEPDHDIREFLASRGTTPEEIDYVILTHLHIDHCSNIGGYPNAKILVQRSEIPWGLTPPPYAHFHWREFTPYISAHVDRMIAIDGDMQLLPGLNLWHVGGHTPGSMAVAVETSQGTTVIAGDFFVAYQSIDFNWPPGCLSNLPEWEQNCRRIKAESDLILPSHDYRTYEFFPEGVLE